MLGRDPPSAHVLDLAGGQGRLQELSGREVPAAAMGDRFRKGKIGYGDAKKMLAEQVVSAFAKPGNRYRHLIENRSEVDAVLRSGAEIARERARVTMETVRQRVGA